MKTLIIIPAYNEVDNLLSLVGSIKEQKYDYLVINDCSSDNTEVFAKENNINILNLPVNMGLTHVTQIGFKYAFDNNYDCVVCIDGDGQHIPSYINVLVKEIEKGNDYVIGSRFIEEKKPISLRMMGSSLLSLFIKIKTGCTINDPTSGMRACGKKIIEEFSSNMNFYSEPDTACYLMNKHYKIKEVQVKMKDREKGESYFKNPIRSIRYMISEIIMILFIR